LSCEAIFVNANSERAAEHVSLLPDLQALPIAHSRFADAQATSQPDSGGVSRIDHRLKAVSERTENIKETFL
jgi:hypothetical protein